MSATVAPPESRLRHGAAPTVSIREVLRESQNGLSKRQGDSGEPVPVLRLANVVSGAIDESDAREIRLTDKEIAKYSLEPGDLLCIRVNGSRNLVGRLVPFVAQRRWAYCDHFIRLRPNQNKVDSRYLAHYLDTRLARREVELKMVSSAGQSTVSQGTMLDLHVPLPDLPRQREIVSELEKQFSRLDEAVANLKRVKSNLKRHKVAVLDAAVKGRIEASSAANLDELPTGWRWSSVGEIASVGTGATPARSNVAFYRGGTIPWITSSAVNEPFVDAADQFVTDQALRQTNLALYSPGTLLVAMYGEGKTRGKCSELRIAATTNQALAALQVDPAVRPWLKLFLEHNYDNTRGIASGGVQPNLNLRLIRAIRLPLPPPEEQCRIVAEVSRRLSIVREVEAEVDANLKRARALRQAVLARAFAV